jgi:hypothetical protein
MSLFESEIQELVYVALTGDSTLSAYLGADPLDTRIYLPFNDIEAPKISAAKPAYIVIETMPTPAPIRLGCGIDDRTEPYCLHVYIKPENRDLSAAIEGRFRKLFHGKDFITAHLIVYHVFESGREGTITETGLYNYRYMMSFRYLPKGV